MRFDVVTIFPELLSSFARTGLIGKAIDQELIALRTRSPREFARDRHRSVDDAPYGGGSGMVMMPGPIADALDDLDATSGLGPAHRILLSPQGAPFGQRAAERLASEDALALVCGRYEGVDERIRHLVHEELSLGDFVLLGGEVAAMAVIEAVARLVPGVLGNESSSRDESHVAGLLEYPQYTRPPIYRDMTVPEVLLSGHHAAIARFRRKEALRRTRARRPDLFAAHEPTALDRELIAELDREPEPERSAPGTPGDDPSETKS